MYSLSDAPPSRQSAGDNAGHSSRAIEATPKCLADLVRLTIALHGTAAGAAGFDDRSRQERNIESLDAFATEFTVEC